MAFKEDDPNAPLVRLLKTVADTVAEEYGLKLSVRERANMVCSMYVSYLVQLGHLSNTGSKKGDVPTIAVNWRDFINTVEGSND